MERFGAAPVLGSYVRAACDQVTCHIAVVAEGRRMQRSVAFVDLSETLGKEKLVASL